MSKIFGSFALDPSTPVMVPFDTSITSPGNVELSAMDITKLQKAYGCSGCGDYQRSFVGGIITGIGAEDLLSPCEWVLEIDTVKGIRIKITVSNYTIVMDCIRKVFCPRL